MKSHAATGHKGQLAALLALVALFCCEAEAGVLPKLLTNSLGMEFVLIQPGTFTMGRGADPKLSDNSDADYDEQPGHPVTITKVFYLTRQKVRKAAYERTKLAGSASDASWNDATAFCRWLSEREKKNYRLPTEAEWEYAFKKKSVEEMDGREWVRDWHGIFSPDAVKDPLGPLTGMTKVIREGTHRLSLSPDAKSSPWELKETDFRVVLETEQIHGFFGAAICASGSEAKPGASTSRA